MQVITDEGDSLACDLLVGADGYQSTIRRQLEPEIRPIFAGYIAWRGVLEEHEIAAVHQETFEGMFSIYRPDDHGYFLGFFIPGADGSLRRGARRLTWAWLRNTSKAAHQSLTLDRFGRQHEVSMYEGGLRSEARAALVDEARRRYARSLVNSGREAAAASQLG